MSLVHVHATERGLFEISIGNGIEELPEQRLQSEAGWGSRFTVFCCVITRFLFGFD